MPSATRSSPDAAASAASARSAGPAGGAALRVIVNADDLGLRESNNDAIFDGIAGGVITSSTLMATGPAFESAARRTREFPHASFGVHLNLTTHRPLTRNPALAPLLGPDGEFTENGIYDVRWTSELRGAVVDEWTAQVKRAMDAGVAVSHLDGHNHCHTVPGAFPALKAVQRAFGLRRVRTTWSIYDRAHAPSRLLRVKKRVWFLALRHWYRTRTTDEFADFLMFLQAVQEGSYAPRAWPRTIELMVHPDGHTPESLQEAAALRSGWLATLPIPAQLVSYREV